MTTDNKWKSRLLSSSLPLEYEIAKILTQKGFTIRPDYTYSRNDAGVTKDFSADIEASQAAPFGQDETAYASLSLVAESKFRLLRLSLTIRYQVRKTCMSHILYPKKLAKLVF